MGDDTKMEILKVFTEKIDLVLMLSHEGTCLEHHFFDVDKEKIVLNMPCSILLVKA